METLDLLATTDLLENLMTIADAERSRRSWDAALNTRCPDHDAPAGQPCWPMPAGLCGRRVRASGFRGKTSNWAAKPHPHRDGKSLDRKIMEATR